MNNRYVPTIEEVADYLHFQVETRQKMLRQMPENSAFWAVKPALLEELDVLRTALGACEHATENEPNSPTY